jgi:hypothetical protein
MARTGHGERVAAERARGLAVERLKDAAGAERVVAHTGDERRATHLLAHRAQQRLRRRVHIVRLGRRRRRRRHHLFRRHARQPPRASHTADGAEKVPLGTAQTLGRMADHVPAAPAATKRERDADSKRRLEALRAARLRAEAADVPVRHSSGEEDEDADEDERPEGDHTEPSPDASPYGPFLTEAAARADVFVGVQTARPASPLYSPPAAPPAGRSLGPYRERASDDPDEDDDGAQPSDDAPGPLPQSATAASAEATVKADAADADDADDADDAEYWRQVARLGLDTLSSPFEVLFERGLDARAQPPADTDVADLVDALRTLAVRGPGRPEDAAPDAEPD